MKQRKIRQLISYILVAAVVLGCIKFDYMNTNAGDNEGSIRLYFVDNTPEQWIENDSAVMELVDNTNGHIRYPMTKADDRTWSVSVPETAYNITFNRYNADKTMQWNSWSAGGRDTNNAYYADGSEYGHWGNIDGGEEENYFHAGDIVYLDVSELTAWENDNALMYVNFSSASKEDNAGNDVSLTDSDVNQYNPQLVDYEEEEHIYAYIVTKQNEGKDILRFWRGNERVLWNCSVTLTYNEYKMGKSCVKVKGWDSEGMLSSVEYDINLEVDTDNDGVSNYIEAVIGLDKRNADTDGDGLKDGDEILITDTDPAKYDSVTDSIPDSDIDGDKDGLTNLEEITFGTNPNNADTDNDGLTDYEEIYIYGTDPAKPDTDEDGLNDGDEIVLGLNPNKQDSDEDGIPDCDECFEQTVDNSRIDKELFSDNNAVPSLTVLSKGNVNSSIKINEYTGHLKGDERAYVGKAVEITGAEINEGSLSFALDEIYKVKSYEIDDISTNGLLICYNDGESTTPLETVYDEESRTLSADISADGIYFVLDVPDWLDSLGMEPLSDNAFDVQQPLSKISPQTAFLSNVEIADCKINGQVDIVFVIDTTGSMGGYIQNVKNNITAFVNEIEDAGITPSFALVDYKDITCDGQNSTNVAENADGDNWFKNAEEFKAEIAKLSVSGGGDGPETAIDGLEMARRLKLRTSSQKFFILVTDADYKTNNNYGINTMDEMIELLANDEINVSVVSNLNYQSVYQSLYEKTGGIFANIGGNFKDELLMIADMIDENTNSGYWIALNGLIPRIVRLKEKPVAGGTTDTDLDTLSDTEELMSVEPSGHMNVNKYLRLLGLPNDYSYPTIPVYWYYSDPTRKDSDGDGLEDGQPVYVNDKNNKNKKIMTAPKDSQPLVKNGTKEIWQAHIDNEMNNVIPTKYSNGSGLDISFDKDLADEVVKLILKTHNIVNDNDKYIRKAALALKKVFEGNTKAGAYILNFIYDSEHMAYHSQPDTWQREFGYNKFYDDVFRIGSYMDYGRVTFSYKDDEYALWLWKGDYWNLQSGAEVGLYTYDATHSGIKQYNAVDFEVPMSLFLYNYHSKDEIENVFSWRPEKKQWWVTGFNPRFKEPNPKEMVSIGTIDLSDDRSLYKAFRNNIKNFDRIGENNIVFDDDSYMIWIIWYNKEHVL